MAKYLYVEVVDEYKKRIKSINFFVVSIDEVTIVDTNSWISVHVYIVEDWVRVSYLIALEEIQDTPTSNILIQVILAPVEGGGGLDLELISKKMVHPPSRIAILVSQSKFSPILLLFVLVTFAI